MEGSHVNSIINSKVAIHRTETERLFFAAKGFNTNHIITGLSMKVVQLHSHAPTPTGIYLGMLLWHMQNFI